MRYLKRLRIVVSLLFFALTAFLFLDIAGVVSPQWMNGMTFLQFLPSFLKFITVPAIAATGFFGVLLLTLLFGRVYCSSICPLGTMQDVITYLSRVKRPKKTHKQARRFDAVRFGLLALLVILLIAGSSVVALLLDPFSNAGRILTNLVRPLIIGMYNAVAYAMSSAHWYGLDPVQPYLPAWYVVVFAVVVAGVVGYLAFTRGRLYCNLLCPVGAILGLCSRFAVWKVAIDEGDCKGCGLCERVCKGGCIDRKAKTVDFDRCVGCFNCFDVCPRDGMVFKTPWRKASAVDESRRRFVTRATGSLTAFLVMAEGGRQVVAKKPTTVPTGSSKPISPPGSFGIERFTERCTACHLCVDACPSHVLQPSFLQYGPAGILQPRMDYRSGYCNFDCTRCGEICPSGAILPLAQDRKKLTQIGTAKFEKENCIVNTERTDCGACSEHCPTKAVHMVPFVDKLVIPEVRKEFCVGCGACEHACPTKPYKAIIVESCETHQEAKKPPEQKIETPVGPQDDFPF